MLYQPAFYAQNSMLSKSTKRQCHRICYHDSGG